jgi:hypothetical protein
MGNPGPSRERPGGGGRQRPPVHVALDSASLPLLTCHCRPRGHRHLGRLVRSGTGPFPEALAQPRPLCAGARDMVTRVQLTAAELGAQGGQARGGLRVQVGVLGWQPQPSGHQPCPSVLGLPHARRLGRRPSIHGSGGQSQNGGVSGHTASDGSRGDHPVPLLWRAVPTPPWPRLSPNMAPPPGRPVGLLVKTGRPGGAGAPSVQELRPGPAAPRAGCASWTLGSSASPGPGPALMEGR